MKIWKVSPDIEVPELENPCVICQNEEGDTSGVCVSCEAVAIEHAACFAEADLRIPPQSERIGLRKVA